MFVVTRDPPHQWGNLTHPPIAFPHTPGYRSPQSGIQPTQQ
ncbi:MAG: hypothetical protein NW237_03905 [Cyanobacteriota bacterium]|nr:hypothetical protein [Cyanobacteriota bacterium]